MFSRGFFVYLYYTLTVSDESKLKTFKPINDFGGRIPIDLIGFLFNYSIMTEEKKFSIEEVFVVSEMNFVNPFQTGIDLNITHHSNYADALNELKEILEVHGEVGYFQIRKIFKLRKKTNPILG